MALKDLIAPKAALTEEAIESIVKDYIRYDVEEREITFLQPATKLSGKAKALVYLVALQGWPIVAKGQDIPTSAKPAHIGDRIGVNGGSLRPFLKDLKDRHLIVSKDGAYSVRAANLGDIKSEVEGVRGMTATRRPTKAAKRAAPSRRARSADTTVKAKRKASAARGDDLYPTLTGWVADGFFNQRRTLGDILAKFHQHGIIVRMTSLPQYVLRAVRAKPPLLHREKAEVNGKVVWTYQRAK